MPTETNDDDSKTLFNLVRKIEQVKCAAALFASLGLIACIIVMLVSLAGCHLHLMEKHTHYHGQAEKRQGSDLLERIFDVETTDDEQDRLDGGGGDTGGDR